MSLKPSERIFTNSDGQEPVDLKSAMKRGDFSDLKSFFKRNPFDLLDTIKESRLRGRGAFGDLTANKWTEFLKTSACKRYLVVNGQEIDPYSIKNKTLLHFEPYKLIEGCLIAAYITGIQEGVVVVQDGMDCKAFVTALQEVYQAGYLGKNILGFGFDFDLTLQTIKGAYVCRVESALFQAMEGKRAIPNPMPISSVGLYGQPTLVHTVESLCLLPTILRRGAEWFSGLGRTGNEGTRLFSITGSIQTPCLVEESLGISMKDLIDTYAGGVIGGWSNLQAVIPGGISTAFLSAQICDHVRMDYDSLKEVYSGVGTGTVIVMDKSVDLVNVLKDIVDFFHHQSCGQCVACRQGCALRAEIMHKIVEGQGRRQDIAVLERSSEMLLGNALCVVGNASVKPILGFLRHFRQLIEEKCSD